MALEQVDRRVVLDAVFRGAQALPEQVNTIRRALQRLQLPGGIQLYHVPGPTESRASGETSLVIERPRQTGQRPQIYLNGQALNPNHASGDSTGDNSGGGNGDGERDDDEGNEDEEDEDEDEDEGDEYEGDDEANDDSGDNEDGQTVSTSAVVQRLVGLYTRQGMPHQQAQDRMSAYCSTVIQRSNCTREAAIAAVYHRAFNRTQ